jgi:hypothetical protein
MRKLLSIKGWNPQVYQREFIIGDYVAFQMPQSDILRVGIVIETPEGKIAPTIKCLTDNKIYYPYSQDILLFNDNCTAKGLVPRIIEVDK